MAGNDHTQHDHDAAVRTDTGTGGARASRGAARDAVDAQRARFGGV